MTQTIVETEGELEPRRGTRAWIDAHELVELDGELVPACHRIAPGSTLLPGEDDGRCRVIMVDRGRCRAPRLRGMRLCSAHAGGGDPQRAALLGVAAKARLRSRRVLLGIGPNRVANPRQIARVQALDRAHELAAALVDAPLDDASLSTIERQRAVLAALDATFPLQQMTVEVELPATAAAVPELGWVEMQQLAARLLDEPQSA